MLSSAARRCFKFGGGAFLLPYFAALVLIGIPVMCLEFILGARQQNGAVKALQSIHPRAGGLGLAICLSSISIATYYAVLMSWAWIYFIGSFKDPLPWHSETDALTATAAESYFYEDVINRYGSMSDGLGDPEWKIVISLIGVWALIFKNLTAQGCEPIVGVC